MVFADQCGNMRVRWSFITTRSGSTRKIFAGPRGQTGRSEILNRPDADFLAGPHGWANRSECLEAGPRGKKLRVRAGNTNHSSKLNWAPRGFGGSTRKKLRVRAEKLRVHAEKNCGSARKKLRVRAGNMNRAGKLRSAPRGSGGRYLPPAALCGKFSTRIVRFAICL